MEASRVFYRTRLEVTPKKEGVESVAVILEVLRRWIAAKEGRRGAGGSENLSEWLPPCDELISSEFARGGLSRSCPDSFLRTESVFAGDQDDVPVFWAMEYVERDSARGYRFWITEVGLSSVDEVPGECVANIRIRYYDDSTYIYKTEAPDRNVPRFVRDIILAPEVETSCGGIPLRTYAVILTQDNFDVFVEQLIDERRTAPLVVVSRRDGDGGKYDYPVNPVQLARLLTGVAVVYALDRSDDDLERFYNYVFGNPDKPAYKYRLEPGCLRVYWGGVDLDEPSEYDYARHRFFTSEALAAFGVDTVFHNLSAGVSRMFSLRQGEVLGIRSVVYQSSLLRVERLEEKRQAIAVRLHEAEEKRIALEREMVSAGGGVDDTLEVYREQIDVLNELLKIADDKIAEYEQRIDQGVDGFSVEDFEQQLLECEQAQDDAAQAREMVGDLQRENGQLKYRVGQLEEELREAASLALRDRGMEELLLKIGCSCRSTLDTIEIARVAFGDRIVLLDDAVESARAFKGQAGEMFKGLEAMYEHLWPMRFGEDGTLNVDEGEFQARTGFAIAFHEGKHTNRDARLMRLRQHEYLGETYDFVAHLKGGDKKRGHLRIHFIFDRERDLIVVGHCGGHLETYGTQRQ